MISRIATVVRNTLETQVKVNINLDGTGQFSAETGINFLDHMMNQIARNGLFDMSVIAKGDLHIDAHHTVEDIGITLGQALKLVIGNKEGMLRYGHAYVPLDEALSRVVIDLSGRPGIKFNVKFTRDKIGEFDVDLFYEFFRGCANHAAITLHIDLIRGYNAHHIAETIFKAFGRALRMAVTLEPRALKQLPSTKVTL